MCLCEQGYACVVEHSSYDRSSFYEPAAVRIGRSIRLVLLTRSRGKVILKSFYTDADDLAAS